MHDHKRLAQIKASMFDATLAPWWRAGPTVRGGPVQIHSHGFDQPPLVAVFIRAEDADFCVSLRNEDVQWLIAQLEAAWGREGAGR